MTADKQNALHLPDALGCLGMECWCGRKVQPRPAADVRTGVGWSCRNGCTEPQPATETSKP